MSYGFLDIALTPSVRAAQRRANAESLWSGFSGQRAFDRFTGNEASFIAARDSFYLATVSESGWPYVQHRGGPPGFLKLIDEVTLACADYRGNRQYLSVGNLAADNRACLFLMDYAQRARLKMFVRIETLEPDADPALTALVSMPGYKARIERIFRMRLEAFDWNCRQHITPRFSPAELAEPMAAPHQEIEKLESELARLRARLANHGERT